MIYQASAALGLRDLEAYPTSLKDAAATALQIGSAYRFQEAFSLYQQAPKSWGQEQRLHDLSEFFQTHHTQEERV